MKKILLMIGLLFLPLSVSALVDGDFAVTCEKNVLSPGEKTTCSIGGVVVNGILHGFNGNISLGEGLNFVNFTIPSVSENDNSPLFQGDANDGNIMLYTENNLTGNVKIGDFVIEASDISSGDIDVSINAVTLLISESEGESDIDVPISIDPYTIHIPSGDNSLSEIKVNGSVIEGFTSSTTDYVLEVPSDLSEVLIIPTATDGSSTITGDVGTKQIGYGENNFVINVKAENGSERVYNVKIIRPEIRELTSLKINDENIDLVSGTYRYIYKVENDVTSVNIVASAGEGISFSEGFGSRTEKDLKVGNNEFLVKTVDSNGDELVYTIVIDRFNEKGKDVAPKEPKEEKKPSGTVENPKTGITGASIVLVGGCIVLYMVARKKGFIKKI